MQQRVPLFKGELFDFTCNNKRCYFLDYQGVGPVGALILLPDLFAAAFALIAASLCSLRVAAVDFLGIFPCIVLLRVKRLNFD
ncbi:MAG: hypothetical protein KAS59_09615 [Alphaproteobacteria bacterium]|nr:hypothetical protein [Alphaproteobacteria bacterium]